MHVVNMLEAKSRLVEAIEQGAECEILIARDGRARSPFDPDAPGPVNGPHRDCHGDVRGPGRSGDTSTPGIARLFLGQEAF